MTPYGTLKQLRGRLLDLTNKTKELRDEMVVMGEECAAIIALIDSPKKVALKELGYYCQANKSLGFIDECITSLELFSGEVSRDMNQSLRETIQEVNNG